MAAWSRALLTATMLTWTVLTGASGWYAFRGEPGESSAAPAAFAVHDVVTTDGERLVAPIEPGELESIERGEHIAAPRLSPAYSRPQPAPRYAESAGFDARVRPADESHQRTKPEARSARGVIVLDPGHGRGDPGAVHYLPNRRVLITEAESNLMNAELIRDELVALGYEVYLTREGEGRGPGRPLPLQFIVSDLYWRAGLADAVDADVYLAIHGNGARVTSISGPETWYCGKHEEGAANERLATLVQRAMMDALHEYGYFPPDRGIKEDAESHHSGDFCQFVVTRETEVPAALMEFLFLTNAEDARVLADPRSHEILARHVARAIDRFMIERGGE